MTDVSAVVDALWELEKRAAGIGGAIEAALTGMSRPPVVRVYTLIEPGQGVETARELRARQRAEPQGLTLHRQRVAGRVVYLLSEGENAIAAAGRFDLDPESLELVLSQWEGERLPQQGEGGEPR